MTAPRICPACRTLALPARALLCEPCRARVPRPLLTRLRGAAESARRRERGARDRYAMLAAVVVRTARAGYFNARQLALFAPTVGRAKPRAGVGD